MASDQPMNWLDDDQPIPGQERPRYVLEGEEDGTWSVHDTKTGIPGILDDRMLVKMTFDAADNMVELMNRIEADSKRQAR